MYSNFWRKCKVSDLLCTCTRWEHFSSLSFLTFIPWETNKEKERLLICIYGAVHSYCICSNLQVNPICNTAVPNIPMQNYSSAHEIVEASSIQPVINAAIWRVFFFLKLFCWNKIMKNDVLTKKHMRFDLLVIFLII